MTIISEEAIKELNKELKKLELNINSIRERVFMLKDRMDKIERKKEIDYNKLIEMLLITITDKKDQQYQDYIEVIKELIKKGE